jgi:flagellar biosynthetic protein FlhB
MKLLLTISKVSLIGYFVYLSIRSDLDNLPTLIYMPLLESSNWLAKRCLIIVLKVLAFYIAIAAADYFIKKKKYYDDMMMTKQEVKDERKNQEGDPLIKSKIRQKMRALIRASMMKAVPRADVIITNPTHVAVALKYEYGAYAPKVIAKGLRKTALRIKLMGKLAGVPIIEAPPLARSLYRNTEVGQYIPPEFYGAVAAILAKLHKSGKKVFT